MLGIMLLPAPGLRATQAALGPGDHTITLSHGGRQRRYIVHVPRRLARPSPVLLAFHGGGGRAAQFQRSAGLDHISDREGFLAVYPDGTGPFRGTLLTWNAGGCCGRAQRDNVDDIAFIRALIADLAQRTPVDSTRIYATGHSNGGMLAYRLAAEASDLVAAIAPVGGAMVTQPPPTARPVPLLHIHSLNDPRAYYEGGLGPPFPGTNRRVEHPPVPEVLSFWRRLNGCDPSADTARRVAGRPRSPSEEHTATHLIWTCNSAPVEHWRLTVAGHGWPGGSSGVADRIIGPESDVIDASEEVWRFVSRFRKRP